MISLGNVGSENETISEKNLTEVHFVVTNIYGQRQWYRSQRVPWLVTISLGLTSGLDLGRCLLYTASRKSLHHHQEEFTGLHTHLPLSNVILRSLQEGAGCFGTRVPAGSPSPAWYDCEAFETRSWTWLSLRLFQRENRIRAFLFQVPWISSISK